MLNRNRVALLMLLVGVPVMAESPAPGSPDPLQTAVRSRLTSGYLKPEAWPDSLLLLPKPPAEGSRAFNRDQELQVRAVALQSTPRFKQARTDADIFLPNATSTMACAAGREISATATPATDKMLRRTMTDFGGATAKAKSFYKRPRPFTVNNQPQCTPEWDKGLRADGSYPSGHAAIGYGWGMILSTLVPARKKQLLTRGQAFAESRRYCNVHWQSDVDAGITVAKAVFAKLMADPGFKADFAAAALEVGQSPGGSPSCAAETSALALR
jgi:acid phosphatase (class A)